MSGRQRLPAGEPRKASQRRARRATAPAAAVPFWRPGDQVHWRNRIGVFHRDLGDGQYAEIVIADRTYRVRVAELA